MQQLLRHGAGQLGLTLSDSQVSAFERYSQELIAWNQRVNLTGIVEPREIVIKHFLDSLSVYQALAQRPLPFSLIDVGSGAGFPGLPLKIILPEMQLTLLESVAKKTAFLEHLVARLNLPGVIILAARAEEAGRQPGHREQYDVAVARAVAALRVASEYTLPLVKIGGLVILQKGQYPTTEIAEMSNALGILGGKLIQVLPVTVPNLEADRHLVILQKRKPTPPQYPRRPGLPAKKPI